MSRYLEELVDLDAAMKINYGYSIKNVIPAQAGMTFKLLGEHLQPVF